MGQVRECRCGYEYVSDNGIVYGIGEYGAEFNIIVDTFSDLWKKYNGMIGFNSRIVDYVYGDIEDEDVVDWIDDRISRYENHERTARFDKYECYIGLHDEDYEKYERIAIDEIAVKACI